MPFIYHSTNIESSGSSSTSPDSTQSAVIDKVCPPLEQSGSVVQCYPVEGYPLDVVTRIEAVQEGEGDPSPDNVRPIRGWDSLTVTRCGEVVIDFSDLLPARKEIGGLTIERVPDGRFHVFGNKNDSSDLRIFYVYINDINKRPKLQAGTYAFGNNFTIGITGLGNMSKHVFTLKEAGSIDQIYRTITEPGKYDFYIVPLVVVGTKIPTEYSPYAGTTYTQALPETVYGGSYNWATGELVVESQLVDGAVQKMDEPRMIQLAPRQILSIPGVNTLFSNAGDTTVSGRADPIHLTQSTLDEIANARVPYANLKARLDAQNGSTDTERTHRYGILWDKTNAKCTRLYDAAGMTANAYKGTYNTNLVNDFDGRYPWSGRRVVNVDLDEYRRIKAAGGDIFGSIVAWDGDADFKLDGSNGFVGVYTPEFWARQEETSEGVEIVVADRELPGYIHFPATIGGRYFASSDGNGGITSKAGAVPLSSNMEGVNYTLGKLHELARAGSMTLDDVYTWVADTILLCVEFATMDTQSAVGNGVSSLFRENKADLPLEAGTGNSVIVPAACANVAIPGAIIDFGTSQGHAQTARRVVTAVNAYAANADYKEIVFDGAPVTYTTATIVQIHGLTNTEDAQIGSKSGYIGANGKSHAYYRGRIAHANMFRYVLGAYRQKDTGHIWYAKDREQADACDALDTTVHVDSGFALPYKEDGTSQAEGYIKTIGFVKKLPLIPFCTAVGGNSSNPIGDYCWHPAKTAGNTIAVFGGNASNGAAAGRFSAHWADGSGASLWRSAALPFLK